MLKRLRTLWRALVSIILLAALLDITTNLIWGVSLFRQTSAGQLREARSQSGHFSILHPADWLYGETPSGNHGDNTVVAVIDRPKFFAMGVLAVIRRSRTPIESMADVVKWGEQRVSANRAYVSVSLETRIIRGEETWIRFYNYQENGPPPQNNLLIRCIDNYRLYDRGYILSFCAEADDYVGSEPIFFQMIDSFAYVE